MLGRVVNGPLVILLAPRREVELSRLAPDLFDVRRAAYEVEAVRTSLPPATPKSTSGRPHPAPSIAPLPGGGAPPSPSAAPAVPPAPASEKVPSGRIR